LGADLSVTLTGGERPHIGAVAVSQPRPSLKNADETSASTSVITLLGHKENQVACDVAKELAVKTKGTVSVACGIHLDDITEDEIVTVYQLISQVMQELVKLLELSPGTSWESKQASIIEPLNERIRPTTTQPEEFKNGF
jgi:hypothetical protein